jgi:lipopolysaccharide/colanic/teichoic acid biosynthesis glycosyltransferase
MIKFNELTKRLFDFLASFIGIIILSPILIIVSIAIKVDSKGEVMFLQKRVGKDGKPFNIYKFRTMVTDAEKLGKQITVGKDNRITKVGGFLRKYKLDELPQLFNVLKGEMSLVGPRPEVPAYVNLYNEAERKVLSVKPGITDFASIEYKDENEILGKVDNPEEYYINVIMKHKLELNIQYISNNNIFLDIKIIIKTILKCL